MKKAFTLVEILVTMAVLGIILSMALVSFRSYDKKKNLELVTQQVKSALEEAMTLSLSPRATDINISGYGVCFENTGGDNWQYKIYKNENKAYDCATGTIIGDPEDFRSKVIVQDLETFPGSGPSAPPATFYVFFGTPQADDPSSPPPDEDPSFPYYREIYWNGLNYSTVESGVIILGTNPISVQRKIKINNVTGSVNVIE